MNRLRCDVAVIGAGSAGLSARAAADGAGARTLLIEAGPGGTTCARTGCMPSKLLIAAGRAMAATGRLDLFGLRLDGTVRVDGPAVMARVRRERDRFVAGVLDSVESIPAGGRVHGRARFTGPTSLAVEGGPEIDARAIVIATGSRSTVPEPLRGLGDLLLTNETVFELPDLPASLAVIGAGPLGLELALAFRHLGVAVTVLDQTDAVAGLTDPVAAESARTLIGASLDLRLGVGITGAERQDGAARLAWRDRDGHEESATFARVLAAAGRPPNLHGLDLERAGLELDRHGVPLFDRETLRCGTSPIFIAGDADHDRPILHEAAAEGRIAGVNAARFPAVEPMPRMIPFTVAYTDPEIATVGAPWREGVAVGEVDLAGSGRARVEGRNAGVLRVYADPERGLVTGGTIVGPEAEHLGHLLAWAVQRGLTADAMLALPYYHPTLEESLRGAVRKLCGEIKLRPHERPGDVEFGPGG